MIATAPMQIEFMKKAGMPLTTEARLAYSLVEAMRRLAYTHLIHVVFMYISVCTMRDIYSNNQIVLEADNCPVLAYRW